MTGPGRVQTVDDEKNRAAASLLNWVTFIVVAVTVGLGLGMMVTIGVHAERLVLSALVLLAVLGAQIAMRRQRLQVAAHVLVFGVWAVITAWLFLVGGTRSFVVMTYFPVIATTSVAISRRTAVVYGVLSTIALGVLFIVESGGYLPPEDFTAPFRFVLATASFLMTGFVIHLASRLKDEAANRATASDSQYAELVRTAPEGILTVDVDGIVTSTNPAAEQLFGLPSSALIGRPASALSGLEGLPPTGGSTTITRADASVREVEIETRALVTRGRGGTRVNLRDVTAQRAAERDRARLTDQLAQVQKQESIGLLAGGIAHDFNNVITVSLANLQLLQELDVSPEVRELLDEVEQATYRSAELTRKLLAFSRRQVMHVRNVSVNEVVEGLRPMLRRLVTENIEMSFDLAAHGIISADAGQLEQVLVNLVVNARDAMPSGGALAIKTRDEHIPGTERGVVVLSVEDSGTGIPAELLPRVFEPFFTTKPVGRGTGLGLSVVDGIVRQSGGSVAIDSVEHRGTRFEIRLARVEARAPDRDSSPQVVVAANGGRGRVVLLVEDEPMLRRFVQRALEGAGFEVIASADGEDALRVSAELTRNIDVVVADVVMPRLGGPEAVARLRERWPGLRALFVSGYTDRKLEELGALDADSSFLGKPFRGEELVAAVCALLERSA